MTRVRIGELVMGGYIPAQPDGVEVRVGDPGPPEMVVPWSLQRAVDRRYWDLKAGAWVAPRVVNDGGEGA